jgi:hypothetical protein
MKPIIAVPATLALVYRAWSRKSLTTLGILVATATAIVHAYHPWSVFFALLVVFFLSGTAVTKVPPTSRTHIYHPKLISAAKLLLESRSSMMSKPDLHTPQARLAAKAPELTSRSSQTPS